MDNFIAEVPVPTSHLRLKLGGDRTHLLPNHLAIDKAVALIREICGDYVSSDWLLQLAHEGKIKLFGFVREPVYFIAPVDTPVTCTELSAASEPKACDDSLPSSRAVAAVGKFRIITKPPLPQHLAAQQGGVKISKVSLEALHKLSEPIPPVPIVPAAMVSEENTSLVECFAIADYIALEPASAGAIFASTENPRATRIVEMSFEGKRRSIFSRQIARSQIPSRFAFSPTCWGTNGWIRNQAGWRVAETDLFVSTSVLDYLISSSSPASSSVEPKVLVEDQTGAATPKRKKKLVPLTTRGIRPHLWPSPHCNLSKAMAESKLWLMEAQVIPGTRGKCATWNPVRLALCLLRKSGNKRWTVDQDVLEAFLIDNFPEWMDEWYSQTTTPNTYEKIIL